MLVEEATALQETRRESLTVCRAPASHGGRVRGTRRADIEGTGK